MGYNPPYPPGQTTSAASQPVVIANDQSSVPVSTSSATVPAVVTMQNAATANGNGTSLTVAGYATAVLQVTGTAGGVSTVNFEINADGSTWVPLAGRQAGSPGSLPTTTTTDGDFRFDVAGFAQVRARISAYSAGTITVRGYVSPSQAPTTTVAIAGGTQKIGTVTTDQTTHGTTDLVAADVTKVGGTAVDVNSGSKSAGTQRIVLATDQPQLTNAFKVDGSAVTQPANITQVAGTSIAQGHGTAAAAVRVELPTDGTGVVGLAAGSQKVGTVTTDQTTHGTTDLVAADITKVAGSSVATGHGTASGAVRVELPTDGTGVVGAAGTVASAATDSGNPVKTGGKYNASAPTFTDGQRGDTQLDVNGNAKTVEQYQPVYEDNTVGVAKVEQRFAYQAITTATTTTVKSGSGMLHSIVVTGGTAGAITVYDNTAGSGTTIATFSSTNTPGTYAFNCLFNTGLTIVTGAATNITVNYR